MKLTWTRDGNTHNAKGDRGDYEIMSFREGRNVIFFTSVKPPGTFPSKSIGEFFSLANAQKAAQRHDD